MATARVRSYMRTGTGTITVDCTGVDGIVVVGTAAMSAVSIDSHSFVSHASGRVWFLSNPSPSFTTLSVTNSGGNVYVVMFSEGNTLLGTAYDSDSYTASNRTLDVSADSVAGGYAALYVYLNDTYASGESAGWTNDYTSYGADGRVIYLMKRKATTDVTTSYTVNSQRATGTYNIAVILATVGYTKPSGNAAVFYDYGVL